MALGFLFIIRRDKKRAAQTQGDAAAQSGVHEPLLVDRE